MLMRYLHTMVIRNNKKYYDVFFESKNKVAQLLEQKKTISKLEQLEKEMNKLVERVRILEYKEKYLKK